jgi:UDP-N-acetylmuramoylalanine--D-glutamate ligase
MTNLAPNHLDWHGTFEHYQRSKETIFRHQQGGDVAIRPGAFDAALELPGLRVPGAHNRENARRAAAVAAAVTGRGARECAAHLASFRGLPHRLELVFEGGGVRAYNDSKCTTPQGARLAVEALAEAGPIHLIAGGYDKGIDLAPLAELAPRVRGLYAIGATAGAIASLAPAGARVQRCGTLQAAVAACAARLGPGEVLLLSPGCASWDQFENYEARGAAFVEAVERELGSAAGV